MVNIPYQLHVEASDPDGNPLSFNLDEAPSGMSIGNAGDITWTPSSSQSGLNLVKVIVSDQFDMKDSVSFHINVLDSISAASRVSCNLPLYYGYGARVIVEATDLKKNYSEHSIDSVIVNIHSQSDPVGFSLWCSENSTNSGKYIGSFVLNNSTNLQNRYLKVIDLDTFFVTYNDSVLGTVNVVTSRFHQYEQVVVMEAQEGWNMVSLPLRVDNSYYRAQFPGASSSLFKYVGDYQSTDTLVTGQGYWLKFNADQFVEMMGMTISEVTISVLEGWNLIGSITTPVLVSSVSSDPPGLITSQFFGYESSYLRKDTIYPGKGYWVKVIQDGSLILSSSGAGLAKSSASRIRIVPISELPPPPPEGNATSIEIPRQFALEQNYPNPFNPITVFRYQLPIGSKVSLRIYNLLGQEIKTLIDEWQDAGYKTVEWDASNFASSVYFYRINAGSFIQTKKLILMR
jgi:hypothetical protein